MAGNEELFGLEQTRGWTKLVERMQSEHHKCRSTQDAATEQGNLTKAAIQLGWVQCLKWVSQLPSQMSKNLPKEK